MTPQVPDVDALLQSADRLPDRFDGLKGRLRKAPLIRWDEYPDVTLHKLEVLARSAYLAGTYLIRDPDVAYRAEDLARAVLECLAHVTFIAGLPPLAYKRGPSERALCVELGMVKGLNDLLKKLPDEALMQDPTVRLAVEADERDIRALHHATGCRCAGRSEGNVGPTLRDAAAAVGPPWTTLFGVYASASTLVHQALINRLVREVAPGITDWVPADDEHRVRLLTWLVIGYSQIVEQILYLHDPSIGVEFRELALEILRQSGSVAPRAGSPGESGRP